MGYDCRNPSIVAPLDNCTVDGIHFIGDGYCDAGQDDDYNTRACDWDGGDCCHDTCGDYTSTYGDTVYSCGVVGTLWLLSVRLSPTGTPCHAVFQRANQSMCFA